MNQSSDIMFMAEYIKNVLYFATVRQGKTLKSTVDTHYFCIDNELVYENYYSDFGPLNLGCVYRYCRILSDKINQYLNKQTIVHYTSVEPKKKVNSAFLIGCYGVLYLSLTPRDALKPLLVRGQNYRPFQDVTQGDSCYTISLMDCLQAIKKARDLGFFNFQDFDYDEYNRLDKIHGGDLNWIVPGKFLAFIGPVDTTISLYHPPEMYINYFLENDVKIVIRLNKRMYDADVFSHAGILHYDLFFPDGSHPPRHIMFKFLQISEEADCAIAVHCKAGLGRTGSLIGSYLIKHYRMTSHEAIGWMRICRPGSVIGHQQAWLEKLEAWLMKQGNIYRKRIYQDANKFPYHEFGIYSFAEKNARRRSVIFQNPPSPPPSLHMQKISNVVNLPRPQNSRMKEDKSNEDSDEEEYLASCDLTVAPAGPMKQLKGCVLKAISKAAEKERDRRLKLLNLGSPPKTPVGDHYDLTNSTSTQQRGSGSGEPKTVRPTCRNPTIRSPKESIKMQESSRLHSPIPHMVTPSFRTTQVPIIKTVNDARNLLKRTSTNYYSKGTENSLTSNLMVNPHTLHLQTTSPVYTTVEPKTQVSSQYRRRLGRSPSPAASRKASEQTRATNTPESAEKFILKEVSKSGLKDVFSRITAIGSGREGLRSLCATSLAPSRVSPAAKRPPRVRSDERPLATQGDILNSIKFQRRLREPFVADKVDRNGFIDKNNLLPKKPVTTIKNDISRGINVNKHNVTQVVGTQVSNSNKDKPIPMLRSFFGPQRPMSPKGRRNTYTTY